MPVVRFGISLEKQAALKLEELVRKSSFPNRSKAIEFLIENYQLEEKKSRNKEVCGAITMVYNHHQRDLHQRSNSIQHDFHHLILAVQHIHLNHDLCLETISVAGKTNDLKALYGELRKIKGVKSCELVINY